VTVTAEGYAPVTTALVQGETALQGLTVALSPAQKGYLPVVASQQDTTTSADEEAESWTAEQMRAEPE
jgi:hypothetical protein